MIRKLRFLRRLAHSPGLRKHVRFARKILLGV
jgi:hypothetical protein